MLMPDRSYSSESYRYGFGGHEKDNEVAGVGNSYTAMFWQYDSRLGRRWNVDPVQSPWESSYAVFGNNPIRNPDENGDCWYCDALDYVQTGLDVAGLIPGVGIVPDLINAGISGARGDAIGVASSLASAIPIVGIGAGVGKLGYKVVDAVTSPVLKKIATETVEKTAKKAANDLPKFQKQLQEIANKARANNPGKGSVPGTKSHTEFEKGVNKLGYDDVKAEQFYKNGQEVSRRAKGSVGSDVTVVGSNGKPVQHYDLKTGKAKVTSKQEQKVLEHSGGGNSVIEIKPIQDL